MQTSDGIPPKSTRRIFGWNDLPGADDPALYTATDSNGNTFQFWARGKRRRVLEGLMRSPLYAASCARLSDHVDHLHRDGVDIETTLYRNDRETQRQRYGVYELRGTVVRSDDQEAA